MFSTELGRLQSSHPCLRDELASAHRWLITCGPSAILEVAAVARVLVIDEAKADAILRLYVAVGVLETATCKKCRGCTTLNDVDARYCTDCSNDGEAMFDIAEIIRFSHSSREKLKARPKGTLTARENVTPYTSDPKLHIADADLSAEHIKPWVSLPQTEEGYLVDCERIGDDEIKRVLSRLERLGICLIRASGFSAKDPVLEEIAAMLGVPADDQNAVVGSVKRIAPTREAPPTTGNSSLALGPHVDGTQDPTTPQLLMFRYVVNAELGARSQFWDIAQVLLEIPEDERIAMIARLSRPDAAEFKKSTGAFRGPLISLRTPYSAAWRYRVDDIIQVHPDVQADHDRLQERLAKRGLEYLPRRNDIVVFDNWRIMHGRSQVEGETQRLHDRIWIREMHPEIQIRLGLRPLPAAAVAALKVAGSRS
ncbi:MAG: TauD/TfdA family dioxygenase [Kofleriaceae bacterium]|nr:TauD/TfdA family dioxygenase [Myxococcales bacterium]MCB9564189.1 TauD/TfdA family dioxygenase [Kofleriaceae bacterium]